MVNVTLKERETNQIVFKGKEVTKTERTSVVAKGTRFKFIRSNSESYLGRSNGNNQHQGRRRSSSREEVLIARGPLLGPIVVMASSNQINLEYKASVTFTVSKPHDGYLTTKLRNASKNEWVIKGWSRCSKECGEGKQHLIVRYCGFYSIFT
jgi:hypothetical protein